MRPAPSREFLAKQRFVWRANAKRVGSLPKIALKEIFMSAPTGADLLRGMPLRTDLSRCTDCLLLMPPPHLLAVDVKSSV